MFKIRPAEGTDTNLILNSWLKRYRDAISVRLVTDKVYYDAQHKVIRHVLGSPGLKVLVACDPQDPDMIYGYAVGEQLTDDWFLVHWVYVKGVFRKFGIGKALVKDLVGSATKIQYTHRTHLIDFLNKEQKAQYNCYYIWSIP